MLIYPSAKDRVTVDSHRRRMKLLNSQHRDIYFFFLFYDPSWALLSFCMSSLPSELEWHMSASFVFTTMTRPWLYSSVLPKNIEPSPELKVERTSAKSKVTWGERNIHLGACNNWAQSKPHGDGGPSCQQGSRELVASRTLQGMMPIRIRGKAENKWLLYHSYKVPALVCQVGTFETSGMGWDRTGFSSCGVSS